MIKKIYLFFLLIVGIGISVIAGFFSISGLTTIFKGSEFSVLLMGTFLEIAKVNVSVYIHFFWKDISKALLSYLVIALFILMCITSLGIYGYLSKSFFSSTDTSSISTKVESMNISLEIEKSKVKTARDEIDYLNNIPREEKKNWHIYRVQKLSKDIDEYSKKIDTVNEKYITEKVKLNSLESEVGPLKYLAMILYQDKSQDAIAKSVQIFIIFIVCVFDPLAILTILSAINGFEIVKKKEQENIIIGNKEEIIQEIKHIVEEEVVKDVEKEIIRIEKSDVIEEEIEEQISNTVSDDLFSSPIKSNRQEMEKQMLDDFSKKRKMKKRKIEEIKEDSEIIEEEKKEEEIIEVIKDKIEEQQEIKQDLEIIEEKIEIKEEIEDIDFDVFNSILEEVVESNKNEEEIEKMYKNTPMVKGRFQ